MADTMHELIIKTENELKNISRDKNLTFEMFEKTQSILKARLRIEQDVFMFLPISFFLKNDIFNCT